MGEYPRVNTIFADADAKIELAQGSSPSVSSRSPARRPRPT